MNDIIFACFHEPFHNHSHFDKKRGCGLGPNALDCDVILQSISVTQLEMPCSPGKPYYKRKTLKPTLFADTSQQLHFLPKGKEVGSSCEQWAGAVNQIFTFGLKTPKKVKYVQPTDQLTNRYV